MAGMWTDLLLNAAADAAADAGGYVSGWFTDWDTVFNEVTSRETVTWPAAGTTAGGVTVASNQPVLDVNSTCTLSLVALFPNASTGWAGVRGFFVFDDPVVYTEAGTYTLTAMSLSVANPA